MPTLFCKGNIAADVSLMWLFYIAVMSAIQPGDCEFDRPHS
jgi:hypothetical protein